MPGHTNTQLEHDITFFKTQKKYVVTFMDATDCNKWEKHA